MVNPDHTYEVGDRFDFDLEGALVFEINAFGGGEYVFYVMDVSNQGRKSPLSERPRTKLRPEAGADSSHIQRRKSLESRTFKD